MNLPKTCTTEFLDPDDLLNFKLIICPDDGFYKDGSFKFNFKVGPNYPHEPPKVKCETKVGVVQLWSFFTSADAL